MNTPSYAIITPAHDEAHHLPVVVKAILSQEVSPVQWVIVDDRSRDETWSVIQEHARLHAFITPHRLDGAQGRELGGNVVRVFEQGRKLLKQEVDFLVKMDADVVLPPEYFRRLLDQFAVDARLGMASGKTYVKVRGRWILERSPDFHVYGPCKTYRSTCLEQIGLRPQLGWDILDGAAARMKGWTTRSYADLPIYHLRMMGSARGMIRGQLNHGKGMWAVRAHPAFVLGRSLYRAVEPPCLSGLLIGVGYLLAGLRRDDRLPDGDLARFLRREQLSRIVGGKWRSEAIRIRTLDCP